MAVDEQTDVLVFPSQTWFDQYRSVINDDEEYRRTSEGWGVGFDGDFVFTMTEVPVPEIQLDEMPPRLREEFDQFVTETTTGYTAHAFLGLEDGRCTDARLVADPAAVEHGFQLTAVTPQWEQLLRGNVDIIQGLMGGHFALDGDMQRVLQYSGAAQRLTTLAAGINAAFASERFAER